MRSLPTERERGGSARSRRMHAVASQRVSSQNWVETTLFRFEKAPVPRIPFSEVVGALSSPQGIKLVQHVLATTQTLLKDERESSSPSEGEEDCEAGDVVVRRKGRMDT